MSLGVPYDSREGRAIAAALTAIMCGHAYKTSAEMAEAQGAVRRASPRTASRCSASCACTATRRTSIDRDACRPARPLRRQRAACDDWDEAVRLGEANGYRNAQATVLAPTGTIGLLMDCDTTGIEPDFALVKFKKLAGGGYFKIVNQTVPHALRRLGYSEREVQEIVAYVSGTNTLLAAPHVNRRTLKEKGLTDAELAKVEAAIPGVFDLDSAFAAWVIGEDAYERLGATKDVRAAQGRSRCSSTSASRGRRSTRRRTSSSAA